ncbi:hypothetical protein Nm8I071_66410 [Nonomuraea sp. TT08I-71]|nr:hypothetical protein Nm8I071_66410 [Nonomuraea sp. TT08I-71]
MRIRTKSRNTKKPPATGSTPGRGLQRVVNLHGVPTDVFTNDITMVLHKKFIEKRGFIHN